MLYCFDEKCVVIFLRLQSFCVYNKDQIVSMSMELCMVLYSGYPLLHNKQV